MFPLSGHFRVWEKFPKTICQTFSSFKYIHSSEVRLNSVLTVLSCRFYVVNGARSEICDGFKMLFSSAGT